MHFDFEKMPIDWQDNIMRVEGAALNVKKTLLKFSNFMRVAFFMPTNSPVSNQNLSDDSSNRSDVHKPLYINP